MKTLRQRLAPAPRTTLWKGDSSRGSRHERGYGWEWEKLRAKILDRDEGLCQPCIEKGRTNLADQVDHRTPKSQGGTDDESNLQSICTPCHDEKTRREMRGGGV